MRPVALDQGRVVLKRRPCLAPGEARVASPEEPLADLSMGIKRIKLAIGSSGQLRLKRDMEDVLGVTPWIVEIDENDSLAVLITVGSTLLFRLQFGRFYPNTPPVVTDGAGHLVRLSILEEWRPVFTLSNVLENLVQVSRC